MARQMRAFSFDVEVMVNVDNLVAQAADSIELQTLFVAKPASEGADTHFLHPADYEYIYSLLKTPPKDPKRWDTHRSERRFPVWENLQVAVNKEADKDRLQKIIVSCQKSNRGGAASARRNASRIMEALVNLGLEALKEKVARLESERSKRTNGGESKNKLSVASRRKTA